jgi:VWFA-related protein
MEKTRKLAGSVVLGVGLILSAALAKQSPPPQTAASNQTMVVVPVTVTDPLGRFFTGLDQSAFEVYEDNVRQTILSFGSEDAPASIGIVFDTSASMAEELEPSERSVAEFFRTLNPEDEAFLVEFNDRPQVVVPLTHNLNDIQNALKSAQPKGRTALRDGVYLALTEMAKAHNPHKALIVISDGVDNSSRYNPPEVINLVRESDVQIYSIGIYGTRLDLSGSEMLRAVSEPTGGRHFDILNLAELRDVVAKIGIELRDQYVIGYRPANQARDGKFRKVQVKIIQPRGVPTLHPFWRAGYFAPTN